MECIDWSNICTMLIKGYYVQNYALQLSGLSDSQISAWPLAAKYFK